MYFKADFHKRGTFVHQGSADTRHSYTELPLLSHSSVKVSNTHSTHLAEVLVQVGESTGNDSTVRIALCSSSDGKGFPTSGLAISKDGAIVPCQHSVDRKLKKKNHHRIKSDNIFPLVTFSYSIFILI